jgi:uncharacterized protein VirK/YbjX
MDCQVVAALAPARLSAGRECEAQAIFSAERFWPLRLENGRPYLNQSGANGRLFATHPLSVYARIRNYSGNTFRETRYSERILEYFRASGEFPENTAFQAEYHKNIGIASGSSKSRHS